MPGARSQLVLLVLSASTAAGEEFFLAEEKSCEAGSWHGDAENSAHFAELMVSLAKAPAAEPLCKLAGCPEGDPAPLPTPVLPGPAPRVHLARAGSKRHDVGRVLSWYEAYEVRPPHPLPPRPARRSARPPPAHRPPPAAVRARASTAACPARPSCAPRASRWTKTSGCPSRAPRAILLAQIFGAIRRTSPTRPPPMRLQVLARRRGDKSRRRHVAVPTAATSAARWANLDTYARPLSRVPPHEDCTRTARTGHDKAAPAADDHCWCPTPPPS